MSYLRAQKYIQEHQEAVDFLKTFYAAFGVLPSYQKYVDAGLLGSKSTVHRFIHYLIELGALKKLDDGQIVVRKVMDSY